MTSKEEELQEMLDASMKANGILWDRCERMKKFIRKLIDMDGIVTYLDDIKTYGMDNIEEERELFHKLMRDNGLEG